MVVAADPRHGNAYVVMDERQRRIEAWVAAHILPHEPKIRAWLSRARTAPEDIDDVIQEAYCRLATLDSVEHIERPHAYFFSIVRNLLVRRLKRAKIVPIETIAEIDSYADERALTPERETAGRLEYARVRTLIAALPDRCRRIVEMRKIDGVSQREIARRMGVSESVVENQVQQGIRAVLRAMRDQDASASAMLDATSPAQKREGA